MRCDDLVFVGILSTVLVWPAYALADHVSSARAAIKKGDLRAAQIELRNAIRNDPQNAEAHYWFGRVAIELGDPVAAERAAMAARDRGYDPSQAVPLQAQAMLAQSKFEALLDTLRPDGSSPSLDASILVSRGYAQIGLKQPEAAQKSFAEAQKIAPSAVEPQLAEARLAVARADLLTAESRINSALNSQPRSAEALLAKSQLQRLRNDASGAIAILDDLIREQPGVMQARLDRASLLLALGRGEQSKADIDAVLKATPGNVQGIYLRAVLSAQARNFKAADGDLERISAYLSRIQRAYFLQAVVKEQLGQYEQADDAARKYIGRNPNDLAAYKILARIQAVKRRPDLVIDILAKIVEGGKGDAETFDLLGRAYTSMGQPNEAVRYFEKAQAIAPKDIGLQTRLASVRLAMGDVDAALEDLEETLQTAPKMPAVGEALFFAALATGDSERAQASLARIREAQGETEVVGNLEGLYKLSLIDIGGAHAVFEKLSKRYPDFVPAKVNLARTLIMLGRGVEGEKILIDVLAKQPASDPALGLLVTIYLQSGRQLLAIGVLERAVTSEVQNTRLRVMLGDLYIRVGSAQKAIELVAKDKGVAALPTDLLSLRAAAQLALGQKKDAQGTYGELLKIDPALVGVRRQLVALLVEAGDFEAARNSVKAGIAVAPNIYQLYQDYALIDLRATGVDAALSTADRLVSQDRENSMLGALRGDIYLAANRPSDALQAYRQNFDMLPSATLVNRMAGALMRLGRPLDAITLLSEWIDSNPSDFLALEQLAEIYIVSQDLERAAKRLEAILERKPYEVVALNNLAWVYQQRGDQRAYGLARQAYLLAPGPQTADTLGWILVTSGQSTAGLGLLRQALLEAPNDPRVRYHFSIALRDTGSKEEAIKHLRIVSSTPGDFIEKREALETLRQLENN
jgi:putative PEP-CTERM system TPR-repeat lipoprotein